MRPAEVFFEPENAKPKIPRKLPKEREIEEFPRRLPQRIPTPQEIPVFPQEVPVEPNKKPLRIPVPAR